MPSFESGVKSYVMGYAVIRVGFPVAWNGKAEIACKHCNYFIRATQRCALNQEVVNFPEHFVGNCCPLEIVEEDGSVEESTD